MPVTPDLVEAVWADDHLKVVELIRRGANPDTVHERQTALCWAADLMLIEPLRALVAAGADVNWRDETGRTPLMRAAFGGHLEALELLVNAGADMAATDAQGGTVLHYAAKQLTLEPVRFLMAMGADVNTREVDGRDPLYWALSRRAIAVMQEFLRAGARVDRTYEVKGYSLLMLAAVSGITDGVRALIAAGADPAWSLPSGEVAADFVRSGNQELIDLLRPAVET